MLTPGCEDILPLGRVESPLDSGLHWGTVASMLGGADDLALSVWVELAHTEEQLPSSRASYLRALRAEPRGHGLALWLLKRL